MLDLLPTLLDHDAGLLAIIARRWDVDLEALDKRAAAEALSAAMLTPERAAVEWGRLSEGERGALQTLLGAPEHKMAEVQFSRFFGEIRQMGPGRRDREKPHLNPVSAAETLYYRGLVALAFDQSKAGGQKFVYVPPDLAAVLPAHETGYALRSGEEAAQSENWPGAEAAEPEAAKAATTTLVDDLATLLAYLQIERVPSEKKALVEMAGQGLASHWLGEDHPARTALLVALAGSMGLAAAEEGIFKPVPANARRWLEETRPRQVRALAEAWRSSTLYHDLWHTPGLLPEDTGWRSDPLLARQTVLTFLEMAPPDDWWSVADLIEMVKTEEPDFQRPAGDYDSWYIRDVATGDYLRGFESWDRVDGALLWFILTGPMHWLGLTDLGDGGALCRLTVYGRAMCGETDWPDPPEDRAHLTIEADGTLLAPRTLSRYERFQLARITEWGARGDLYVYRLTSASLLRAGRQGIQPDAIQAFLHRSSGGELPPALSQLLERWSKTGGAEVWITHTALLQADSPDALRAILETPELRRYLGAVLSPTAVIVRAGQERELAAALQQHGIPVDFNE